VDKIVSYDSQNRYAQSTRNCHLNYNPYQQPAPYNRFQHLRDQHFVNKTGKITLYFISEKIWLCARGIQPITTLIPGCTLWIFEVQYSAGDCMSPSPCSRPASLTSSPEPARPKLQKKKTGEKRNCVKPPFWSNTLTSMLQRVQTKKTCNWVNWPPNKRCSFTYLDILWTV